MQPIWKDYYVELTDSASDFSNGVQFRIKTGGSIIYQGKAFALPGEDSVEVRINDICADMFLRSNLYLTLFKTFVTEIFDEDSEVWTQVDSVTFRPDWSWDNTYNPANDGCNFPINGVLHPLQSVPVSFVEDSGILRIHNIQGTGSFNPDFNLDFQVNTGSDQYVTYTGAEGGNDHWLNLSLYQYAQYIIVDGVYRLDVKDLCGGCVLYYINAYGYWDSFVPEGRTKVVDGLTRHTHKRHYYNGPGGRGIDNFVNEIARKFTFRTGPLTTEQSKRMHHLLNSPYVIMHDLEKNERWPIILTGNNTEHKDTTGSLHFYDIEAQLAQDMMRR